MSSDQKLREEAVKLKVFQFRLTNGESILGCIFEDEGASLVIDGALQIFENTNLESGEYNYGLKYWYPLGNEDDKTILIKGNIVSYTEVCDNGKESYLKAIIAMHEDIDEVNEDIDISGSITIH